MSCIECGTEEYYYDIYEDNLLIERSVPFKTVQERCAILMRMYSEESSITKLQEYFAQWSESFEVIDINVRREYFSNIKKELISDINEIIEMIKSSSSKNQNSNNEMITNIENWKETIKEINDLECDNKGYLYLLEYFDERGFGSKWIEKLDKVFEESKVNEYEDTLECSF